MNDLLIIQVLGNLKIAILIASIFISFFFAFLICLKWSDREKPSKKLVASLVTSILLATVSCIAPTEEQMYISYGVGSIIDAFKEHKEIPDKAFKAIDRWLDGVDNKNNKEE